MKKNFAMLLATALMIFGFGGTATVANASSASYSLSYITNAPTDICKTSATYTVKSSGADEIKVKSTAFGVYIKNAYMEAKGKSYPTCTQNINTKGTYHLVYTGKTVPKKNVKVTVSLKLKGFEASKSVTAKGELIG